MKRYLLASLLAVLASGSLRAELVAEWNFNGNTTIANVALTSASAILIGNSTATFASGTSNGGSSEGNATTHFAWNTSGYPAQGTGNKTAGVQFNVSTAGYQDVLIEWDTRASNTSSRWQQFQYSLDGSSFVDFGALFENTGGDTWYNNRSINLSSITGANNNPQFAFRLVSAFDPVTGNYTASTSTSAYAPGGTLRFDMVQVNASAIPEPGSIALLGLSGVAMVLRRRR